MEIVKHYVHDTYMKNINNKYYINIYRWKKFNILYTYIPKTVNEKQAFYILGVHIF